MNQTLGEQKLLHIVIVTGQGQANLIPILQFKPDKVVLLISSKMGDQANNFKKNLVKFGNYTEEDVLKLKFIGKARSFNFSIDECRDLLSLYENENRPSKEVKKITLEKISEIDKKLNDLKTLRKELSHLANNCHGDDRPNCPILEALSKK